MGDYADAFAAGIKGAIILALLAGILVGACGMCATQKLGGYRVRIEKLEPARTPPERIRHDSP